MSLEIWDVNPEYALAPGHSTVVNVYVHRVIMIMYTLLELGSFGVHIILIHKFTHQEW